MNNNLRYSGGDEFIKKNALASFTSKSENYRLFPEISKPENVRKFICTYSIFSTEL